MKRSPAHRGRPHSVKRSRRRSISPRRAGSTRRSAGKHRNDDHHALGALARGSPAEKHNEVNSNAEFIRAKVDEALETLALVNHKLDSNCKLSSNICPGESLKKLPELRYELEI